MPLVAAAALVLPAAAWAHAALLHTTPDASAEVNTPPPQVTLTYSEAVEPRFAIVSVTDAAGHAVTAAPPQRDAANPDTLDVPLRHLPEGWYLVYWRVISVDGHPVRGAFTFAVGPNAGPAPQFVIPSISRDRGHAAAGRAPLGRLPEPDGRDRAVRPADRDRAPGRPARVRDAAARGLDRVRRSRPRSALVLTPVYVDVATAKFALRPSSDVGALVPLFGVSAFGHGYLDLELCLALFAARRPRCALGRPAGAGAAVDRGAARADRCARSPRPRRC